MNTPIPATMDRRRLLARGGLAVAGAALASSARPFAIHIAHAQNPAQDMEILNYALTLEHLEAAAYRAAIASGLLSGQVLTYFRAFGAHEAAHVDALTATITKLGGTPVAARASYNLPTFADQNAVVTFFHTVEELGAAAYLGQAPRLQNPDLLTAAVSIHNVEGQHAAVLADVLGMAPSPNFGAPKSMDEVLAVVVPLLGPEGAAMAAKPAAAQPGSPGAMPSMMPKTGHGPRTGRFGGLGRSFSPIRFD